MHKRTGLMYKCETKDHLVDVIDSKAIYRAVKAQEYPNDNKNANSARALAELSLYLKQLPDNHPAFDKIYNMDEAEDELFNERLNKYGYYGDESPEAFIQFEMNLRINNAECN